MKRTLLWLRLLESIMNAQRVDRGDRHTCGEMVYIYYYQGKTACILILLHSTCYCLRVQIKMVGGMFVNGYTC
jgi:hypothetical protein